MSTDSVSNLSSDEYDACNLEHDERVLRVECDAPSSSAPQDDSSAPPDGETTHAESEADVYDAESAVDEPDVDENADEDVYDAESAVDETDDDEDAYDAGADVLDERVMDDDDYGMRETPHTLFDELQTMKIDDAIALWLIRDSNESVGYGQTSHEIASFFDRLRHQHEVRNGLDTCIDLEWRWIDLRTLQVQLVQTALHRLTPTCGHAIILETYHLTTCPSIHDAFGW